MNCQAILKSFLVSENVEDFLLLDIIGKLSEFQNLIVDYNIRSERN